MTQHERQYFSSNNSQAKSLSPCLGVIMPVFNEAPTLDAIIEKVLNQSCVVELVLVDDASTDPSLQRMQKWAHRDSRVRLVRHKRNLGKGAAIRTGLRVTRSEFILIQDGDLEYDPGDYEKLLNPVLRGEADVVYGSRFAMGAVRNPFWHTLGNRFLTWICNRLTGLRLTDEATCYKLFRRAVLETMEIEEDGFGFCPEVTAKVARQGLRLVEVPISYHGRRRAEGKKIRLLDGMQAVSCLVRYSRVRRR